MTFRKEREAIGNEESHKKFPYHSRTIAVLVVICCGGKIDLEIVLSELFVGGWKRFEKRFEFPYWIPMAVVLMKSVAMRNVVVVECLLPQN
jgi:hypothetical protein